MFEFEYTDFNKINLDWLLKQAGEQNSAIENLQERVTNLEEGVPPAGSVFYGCTYGVTTGNEIATALANDLFPVCQYGSRIYLFANYVAPSQYNFYSGDEIQTRRLTCSSDIWSETVVDLATENSPAFTGTPTAPTATQSTNNTQIATTAFVKTAVSNSIDATLSIPGRAADAAETGKIIESIGSLPDNFIQLTMANYAAGAIKNKNVGAVIDLSSFSSTSSMKHTSAPIAAGKRYRIYTSIRSSFAYAYAYVCDSNGVILMKLIIGDGTTNRRIEDFTAPNNAVIAYVSCNGTVSGGTRAYVYEIATGDIADKADDISQEQIYRYPVYIHAPLLNGVNMSDTGSAASGDGARTGINILYPPIRITYSGDALMQVAEYADFTTFNSAATIISPYGCGNEVVLTGDAPRYIAVGFFKQTGAFTSGEFDQLKADLVIKSAVEPPQFANPTMFHSIGVAGCSWTAGTQYAVPVTDHSIANNTLAGFGWGEDLCRRNGVDCHNYAVGGTSIRTWFNWNSTPAATSIYTDLAMKGLLATDACDCYMLLFGGVNDRDADIGFYPNDDPTPDVHHVGSLDDLAGAYTSYPFTFYGYYGRVIEMIQEHAPLARIIVFSPDTVPSSNQMCEILETACREIAEHYNLPFINLREDSYYPYYINILQQNHPTSYTYTGASMMIERLLSKCVENYQSYFGAYNGESKTVAVSWSAVE